MHILEEDSLPATVEGHSRWLSLDLECYGSGAAAKATANICANYVLRTLVNSAKATKSTELHFVCDIQKPEHQEAEAILELVHCSCKKNELC